VDISVSANTATLKTVDSALDLALKQKEQADYRHLFLSLAQEKK